MNINLRLIKGNTELKLKSTSVFHFIKSEYIWCKLGSCKSPISSLQNLRILFFSASDPFDFALYVLQNALRPGFHSMDDDAHWEIFFEFRNRRQNCRKNGPYSTELLIWRAKQYHKYTRNVLYFIILLKKMRKWMQTWSHITRFLQKWWKWQKVCISC